jgi:quinol monooxygenase YgiN
MTKYGLHSKLTAQAGKGDALAHLLMEASNYVCAHHGCLLYMVSKHQVELDSIYITEVWNTKREHDDSLLDTHVRELISKAIPLIAEPPQGGNELIILGGI